MGNEWVGEVVKTKWNDLMAEPEIEMKMSLNKLMMEGLGGRGV